MLHYRSSLWATLILICIVTPAMAKLRVAQIFQDHMVLQQDLKAPVWGWANAGDKVTVSFAGQEKSATADDKGYWMVELEPLKTSAAGRPLTIKSGSETIERADVLVGEVWILSGQSNMARPLRNDSFDFPFFRDYYKDAEYPQIRFINFGSRGSPTPLDDVDPVDRKDQPWRVVSNETAPYVMSIGFFFAKKITKDLNVPVGLVQVAVSGTPQSAWMAKETLEAFPGEKGNFYETLVGNGDARLGSAKRESKSFAEFVTKYETWRKDPAAKGDTWPGDNMITDFPSVLYNAKVHPLAPMAFRGMLWHQGEAGPGGPYGPRMVAMIKQHRELFKNDFYFIFGTITRKTDMPPPLDPITVTHAGINLSMITGDQQFGESGRAALVNFVDLGNTSTHWAMKEEAGRRMALAAEDRAYGQKHLFTGPQLVESKINGSSVTCKFRYAGDGIKYQPSIDGISGIVLVDKKNERYWADVKVNAPDTLVISHPKGGDIAAVYYGFHVNPHETIFNSGGFAAFAFSVGESSLQKGKDSARILRVVGDAKGELNIAHVRQNGYVFSAVLIKGPKEGHLTVKAYVPASWKGVEVRIGDQELKTVESSVENGRRFIQFDAPINGPKIVVCEQGQADAFKDVDRF